MNWSPNGKLMALSLANDCVIIYDRMGKRLHSIENEEHHNIVCCKWLNRDRLIICSLSKQLSFYHISYGENSKNKRAIKVHNTLNMKLSFYPNNISFIKHSCIIVSGMDNHLYLYTFNGIFIEKYTNTITKSKTKDDKDWVLSMCNHAKSRQFFYGTNNGHLICNKIIFKTVHSLF